MALIFIIIILHCIIKLNNLKELNLPNLHFAYDLNFEFLNQ